MVDILLIIAVEAAVLDPWQSYQGTFLTNRQNGAYMGSRPFGFAVGLRECTGSSCDLGHIVVVGDQEYVV